MTRTSITTLFLVLYIVTIIIVGIWNRKSKNSEDFFLAARKLPAWLLSITFIASWWGGGSAIDVVDHAHNNGLNSFWIYGIPVLVATALMLLFAKGTSKAAFISMIFGIAFSTYNLLVALGVKLPIAWEIASLKQALIGVLVSLILYVVVSYFTKGELEKSRRFIENTNVLGRK